NDLADLPKAALVAALGLRLRRTKMRVGKLQDAQGPRFAGREIDDELVVALSLDRKLGSIIVSSERSAQRGRQPCRRASLQEFSPLHEVFPWTRTRWAEPQASSAAVLRS